MKHILTTILLGCATISGSAQYQLDNFNFESWKTEAGSSYQSSSDKFIGKNPAGMRKRPGVEPTSWNGSSVSQKVMGVTAEAILVSKQTNKEGTNSWVSLENKEVGAAGITSPTPAFINFGTPWVYAVPTLSKCDGGVYGGKAFSNRPDAIKGRFNRVNTTNEKAHIIAYLWKGTFKTAIPSAAKNDIKEDVDRTIFNNLKGDSNGELIAKCDSSFTQTNGWEEIIVPLEYVQGYENVVPEKINIIISSADYWNREALKSGSKLEVDDLEFVYYSELEEVYSELNGKRFKPTTNKINIIECKYPTTQEEKSKIKFKKKGSTASVSTEWNDIEKSVVVKVTGSDSPNNSNTYTFNFLEPIVFNYTNDLTVNIDGSVSAPQKTTIQLIHEADGSYSFELKRFYLGEGESAIPVGDIKLTNLKKDGNKYSKEQTISIKASDNIEDWFGPNLDLFGGVPVKLSAEIINEQMVAEINIDMTSSIGQMIKVIFAPTTTINDAASFQFNTGLNNIVLKRVFPAGWNTICLPFTITTDKFGADVTAQAFTSADVNGLTFSSVTTLEANKPYLINFPNGFNGVETPIYLGLNLASTTPEAVPFGAWSFIGTYTGLKAGEMTGKYGVMTSKVGDANDPTGTQSIRKAGAGASINGTRAYFEYHGTANVNSIKLNLEGETTGIGCIENGQLTVNQFPTNIYSLDGRLVKENANSLNGLHKGVYIVNNKKVIVK